MKRVLLVVGGSVCLGLGVIGVVLPLLPTTPFLLLASSLFGASSPSLKQKFRQLRLYQVYVEPFYAKQGMSFASKLKLLIPVSGMLMVSMVWINRWYVTLIIVGLMLIKYLYFFTQIKTIPSIQRESYLLNYNKEELS